MTPPATHVPAKRPSIALAGSLLILGIFSFVFGAALAWGSNPLLGFSIGGVGTVLLVIGSIMARNAMVGRYLEGDGE